MFWCYNTYFARYVCCSCLFLSFRLYQPWLMRMQHFRRRVVLCQSLCGILQQSLIHIWIMLCLFVSTPLNFWAHHSLTWLHQRWDHLFSFLPVSLLWSLLQCHPLEFSLILRLFQVTQFVNGLFESKNNLSIFKNHIRDFLVQSKEFSAQVKTPYSYKLVDCIKDVDVCGHQVVMIVSVQLYGLVVANPYTPTYLF